MAFTTVQGAASEDATSLIGSAGIDSVVLAGLTSPIWLSAQGSGDQIGFSGSSGSVSQISIRGGQGTDRFFANNSNTSLSESFINLNADGDALAINSVTASTIYSGGGADTLVFGVVESSRINGNKGNDTTTIAGATGSSIFGGQGNDNTTLNGSYNHSVIQTDNDDDTLILSAGSSFNGSTINGNACW